jgi:hypothetical protein
MNWFKRALAAIGIWVLIAVAGLFIVDLSGGGKEVGALFSVLGFIVGVTYFIIPLFRRKSSPL